MDYRWAPCDDESMTTSVQQHTGLGARDVARRVLRLIATLVRLVTVVCALLLVAFIVLTVGHANPVNGIFRFVADAAAQLSLGVGDLFAPADPTLALVLNYGLAAILWLAIGIVVGKLIAAVTP